MKRVNTIAILLILLALCLGASASAASNQKVAPFSDGTTATVKMSSNPNVPNLGALHYWYLSVYSSTVPLGGVTVSVSANHGGRFYMKKLKDTTDNKTGTIYADANVGELSGYCKINYLISLTKANGATASVEFEQPISPRMPKFDPVVFAGNVAGTYSVTYNTTNPKTYAEVVDSGYQRYENGGGKIDVPVTANQGLHGFAQTMLYPAGNGQGDASSAAIMQALAQSQTGRISYTLMGILPSKVLVTKSITPSGSLNLGYGCLNPGDASIVARVTMTSPLIKGQHEIDQKKALAGKTGDEVMIGIPATNYSEDTVVSGESAMSNVFSVAGTILINARVGTSDLTNAGGTVEGKGTSTLSVKPYQVTPRPTL